MAGKISQFCTTFKLTNMTHQLETEEKKERPTFLLVLCILTFINTGIAAISGLIGMLGGGPSEAEQQQGRVEMAKAIDAFRKLKANYAIEIMEKLQLMLDAINNNYVFYNGVTMIVALLGAFGALEMFRGKKLGFHFYIGYCFFFTLQIYLFVSPSNIPSFLVIYNVIVSALFILMYSRNLHWMK
jgi:hypothetical protein